jgi:hypothetical protein
MAHRLRHPIADPLWPDDHDPKIAFFISLSSSGPRFTVALPIGSTVLVPFMVDGSGISTNPRAEAKG